jgi:hypothetical protein
LARDALGVAGLGHVLAERGRNLAGELLLELLARELVLIGPGVAAEAASTSRQSGEAT